LEAWLESQWSNQYSNIAELRRVHSAIRRGDLASLVLGSGATQKEAT